MDSSKQVTIIIPNYRTLEMTRLCLHNLRHYTDLSKAEVIVVDNQSEDSSVEYLRTLDWIQLIERTTQGERGAEMHAKALDLALRSVHTPYTLVIHTDTIVLRPDWLEFLLDNIHGHDSIAAVGSWKLEHISWLKRIGKRIEAFFRLFRHRPSLDRQHYFRSHCALYRTELLKQCKSSFSTGDSAGIAIFNELKAQGYQLPFIPSEKLCTYMLHLNHATSILHPTAEARKTSAPGRRKKLLRQLEKLKANND